MSVFLFVLLLLVGVAVIVGIAFWAIWVLAESDWSFIVKVAHTLGCLIAIAAIIAFTVNMAVTGSSNADHCGPGTRYISESHYNPATKTTITDWACVTP